MEYLEPAFIEQCVDVIDLSGKKYKIIDTEFYNNIPSSGHLAEIQKEINGVFIDIDNKFNFDVSSLTIFNIIKTYIEHITSCYYFSSGNYTFNVYDIRKSGSKSVHILIPGLFVSKHIRTEIIKYLSESYEFIDKASSICANIFKGHTKPGCKSSYDIIKTIYKVTIDKQYNVTYETFNNDVTSSELCITNENNCVLKITQTINNNIRNNNDLEPLSYSRREFKTLLNMLPDRYAEDYSLWLNIMFIAKWIDNNPLTSCSIDMFDNPITDTHTSVLEDFIEFSRRCEEKCNPAKIRSDYAKVRSEGLTIRTLHYYVSNENPEYHKTKQLFVDKTCYELAEASEITNYSIAKYLCECYPNDYKCINNKEWLVLKEGKWKETNTNQLSIYLSTTIKDRIVNCINKMMLSAVKEKELLKTLIAKKKKVISQLESNAFKNNVIKEASIFYDSTEDLFDKHESTIGVLNGVIDLTNMSCIYNYNDFNIRKSMNASFTDRDPVMIDKLNNVIESIIPEPDAREFIMCYFASCLSNKTREPLVLLLTGCGCNGKSTLLEFVSNVLGDYASKFHLSLLLDKRESSSSANSAMMAFKNTRFVYSSETNPTDEINTSRLKELTSNEKVTARDLFKRQETFEPNAAICLASNHDIIINSYDHGTWRRLKYYSCKTRFVDTLTNNKYEKLKDPNVIRLVKDPHAIDSFLHILLDYYKIYNTKYGGMLSNITSNTINNETSEYRNRFDPLNEFVTTYCIKSTNAVQTLNDFINEFMSWCNSFRDTYKSFNRSSIKSIIQNSSIVNFLVHDRFVGFKSVFMTDEIKPLTDNLNIDINIILLPNNKYYELKEDESPYYH